MKSRICNLCHIDKPLTGEFWRKDSKGKDGFAVRCTLCKKEKKLNVKPQKKEVKFNIEWKELPKEDVPEDKISTESITLKPTKVEISQDDPLTLALNSIYQKNQRFFTIEHCPTKTTIAFKGSPEMRLIGTTGEVWSKAS